MMTMKFATLLIAIAIFPTTQADVPPLKGMRYLREPLKQFQRMLPKGGNGGGGNGGDGGGDPSPSCTETEDSQWWDTYCDAPLIDDQFGDNRVTKWMSIEPGTCVELDPYVNSGFVSKMCTDSGSGQDIGFLLNGWVEGSSGSVSYQHTCKDGADDTSGGPIAVSYIANKHKISFEVLDSTGVAIPTPSGGCEHPGGFWWQDDMTPGNPLYAEGGFIVVVSNNGNSRQNVRLYTRCNFAVC